MNDRELERARDGILDTARLNWLLRVLSREASPELSFDGSAVTRQDIDQWMAFESIGQSASAAAWDAATESATDAINRRPRGSAE